MLGGGFAFLNVKRVVRIERGRAPGSSYGMALRFGVGLFVAGGLSRGRKCAKRRFILAFSVGDTVGQGKTGSGFGLGAV